MSEACEFCGGPVNPHDQGAWKQVVGWVHGPRKDSMVLREDTHKFAHDHCVQKARGGQAPDQPDLFGDDPGDSTEVAETEISIDDVLEDG